MNTHPILYHGTDARIIAMSYEERKAYFNMCAKIKGNLWAIFKPYYVNEMVEKSFNGHKKFVQQYRIENYKDYIIEHSSTDTWTNLYEKLMMCNCNETKSQLYQYGDLYLTGDIDKAKRYALRSFAGGEIGLIVYRLIQGLEALGWDNFINDEFIKNNIRTIKSFAEQNAVPIVIPISDLDLNYLLTEKGECIDQQNELVYKIGTFRYVKEHSLSLKNAIYLI